MFMTGRIVATQSIRIGRSAFFWGDSVGSRGVSPSPRGAPFVNGVVMIRILLVFGTWLGYFP